MCYKATAIRQKKSYAERLQRDWNEASVQTEQHIGRYKIEQANNERFLEAVYHYWCIQVACFICQIRNIIELVYQFLIK